jgi:hypothetical protein
MQKYCVQDSTYQNSGKIFTTTGNYCQDMNHVTKGSRSGVPGFVPFI